MTAIFHAIEYAVARALFAMVLSLGFERTVRLSRLLSDLFFRVDRKHRERALDNLRHAFPEKSEQEIGRIARDSARSFIRTFAETAWFPRFIRTQRIPDWLRIDIHPAVQRRLDVGELILCVTGHLGNWELAGQSMALLGYRVVSVARPFDNKLLNDYILESRERMGLQIVEKKGAVRELARSIRNGVHPSLLVDQNTGRYGIFVEFFGRPASTTPAAAMLSIRYGIPIVPGYCLREDEGFVFRLEGPIEYEPTGDRELDTFELTQRMTRRVEAWVRKDPDQWLWMHRRWKKQPKRGAEWRPKPLTSHV